MDALIPSGLTPAKPAASAQEAAAIAQARSELEGISPLQHAHLHAYGEYPVDLGSRPIGFRPLRQPAQREGISPSASVNRV